MIRLIVNADDYGLGAGVDRGILEAVDAGVVTSVSALPCSPAFDAAPLRARPQLSVGLHLAFGHAAGGQREELVAAATSLGRATRWAHEQAARLADAAGRAPTHVDAHLHGHALPWVWAAARAVGAVWGIPVRVPVDHGPHGGWKAWVLRAAFAGRRGPAFFGLGLMGRIDRVRIAETLDHLEAAGIEEAEWMVHPGRPGDEHPSWDGLTARRHEELNALLALAPWLCDRARLVGRAARAAPEGARGI